MTWLAKQKSDGSYAVMEVSDSEQEKFARQRGYKPLQTSNGKPINPGKKFSRSMIHKGVEKGGLRMFDTDQMTAPAPAEDPYTPPGKTETAVQARLGRIMEHMGAPVAPHLVAATSPETVEQAGARIQKAQKDIPWPEEALYAASGMTLGALAPGLSITGYLVQMGPHRIDRARFDLAEIGRNPFWVPDARAATDWADYLDGLRKSGDSVGAVIELVARGVPAGLGAPIYAKLDADLAAACMSINAVKAVEIGEGLAAAALTGSANADEIAMGPDGPVYASNHAGGILGGIATGQDVVVRFAVKPTSSILTPRRTVTRTGSDTEIVTKGRHDPCVGIRAVPVGEAMLACVLLDHLLLDRAQTGGVRGRIGHAGAQ
jgi:hypothetical protein